MDDFRPLEGIRVLSFEIVASLPAATRILADFGADVLRVVPPRFTGDQVIARLDGVASSKSTIFLDLQTPEGIDLAKALVRQADVVCNNFTPRVMKRFGLDYPALRALKPDIVSLQLTGFGSPGPWSEFPAYGPSIEASAGVNASIGEEGDEPVKLGSDVFADYVSGKYAVLAILAGLEHRRDTGQGSHSDVAMYESIIHLLGHLVVEASDTGKAPERRSNRDRTSAPQGIYPCAGDDEWLAITVVTDDQWRALRSAIGTAELDDAALDTAEGRMRRHDELDAVISAWTRTQDKRDVATRLQALGIPAGPVQDANDLPVDPQLTARGFFQMQAHREPVFGYGAHPHMAVTPVTVGFRRPPPVETSGDGADNRDALQRWLNLPAGEVSRLEEAGILVPPHPGPLVTLTQVPNTGGAVDPEFAERLGLPKFREPEVAR